MSSLICSSKRAPSADSVPYRKSGFLDAQNDCGRGMPPRDGHLSSIDVAAYETLGQWIEEGALDN